MPEREMEVPTSLQWEDLTCGFVTIVIENVNIRNSRFPLDPAPGRGKVIEANDVSSLRVLLPMAAPKLMVLPASSDSY